MIKLERLGIVLAPANPKIRTVAKYNAGMTLSGDTVHMVFRYSEWRPSFDPACQSNSTSPYRGLGYWGVNAPLQLLRALALPP